MNGLQRILLGSALIPVLACGKEEDVLIPPLNVPTLSAVVYGIVQSESGQVQQKAAVMVNSWALPCNQGNLVDPIVEHTVTDERGRYRVWLTTELRETARRRCIMVVAHPGSTASAIARVDSITFTQITPSRLSPDSVRVDITLR